MPYHVKKVGGTVAHGLVTEDTLEILLILINIGPALLGTRILRRNTFPAGGEQ